jgi:Acyl-CoA synthetases (AMP-forming)/AMP-acid ligases II
VIVDWSPWHHTAGGNHNFGFVLYNGGTLYIDEGKPTPGAIETTVKNLREIATNWYFTVPKGYEALLPFFRADARLRETFFSRLKVLWFAGRRCRSRCSTKCRSWRSRPAASASCS